MNLINDKKEEWTFYVLTRTAVCLGFDYPVTVEQATQTLYAKGQVTEINHTYYAEIDDLLEIVDVE